MALKDGRKPNAVGRTIKEARERKNAGLRRSQIKQAFPSIT
jgi:hypothetical protein